MKSIGLKLWSGMMLLVGIVLLLLWLFQIVFLDAFYSKIEIAHLIDKSMAVISEIEKEDNITGFTNSSDIISSIDDFVNTNQLSLEFVDTNGNTIYQTSYSNGNTMNMGIFKQALNEVFQMALSDRQAKTEITHPKFGSEIMIIGLPVHFDNSVQGAMIITVPMAPIEDTTAILKKQLGIITAILLFAAVIISFKLSKVFTKPVLNITKAAESYSIGEFDYRIRNSGKDEISLLARRMNKMGEELAKNEQLRKDLIANVSHELRTPLSLIRGYAETLRDVTGEIPEKREKQLEVIIDESERLSRIVEDILSLSQFQAGAISLEIKPFSLKEMTDRIMQRYELIRTSRNFLVIGADTIKNNLIGDSGRIEQVLYNLLNNAYNHTVDGSSIIIRAIDNGDFVRIAVEDSGEGIEHEELHHVFDRYYKGNSERSKRIGTGLGLAIVKSILEMHKAQFGVDSILSKGTTFWFELKKDITQTSF